MQNVAEEYICVWNLVKSWQTWRIFHNPRKLYIPNKAKKTSAVYSTVALINILFV